MHQAEELTLVTFVNQPLSILWYHSIGKADLIAVSGITLRTLTI